DAAADLPAAPAVVAVDRDGAFIVTGYGDTAGGRLDPVDKKSKPLALRGAGKVGRAVFAARRRVVTTPSGNGKATAWDGLGPKEMPVVDLPGPPAASVMAGVTGAGRPGF